MTTQRQFHLRLFLFTSIPFFLAGVLVDFVIDGASQIGFGLPEGILFGVLMTTFFSYIQRSNLRKLDVLDEGGDNFNTHQRREIRTQLEREHMLSQLKTQAWIKAISTSDEGNMSIVTAPSTWSWGEMVQLVWRDVSQGEAVVEISSRPRLSWVPFDGAKNLSNIIQIADLIKK